MKGFSASMLYVLIPKPVPMYVSLNAAILWVYQGWYPYLEDYGEHPHIDSYYPKHNTELTVQIKPIVPKKTDEEIEAYIAEENCRFDRMRAALFLALSDKKIRAYGIPGKEDLPSENAVYITKNHVPIPYSEWMLEHTENFHISCDNNIGNYNQILLNGDDLFVEFPPPQKSAEICVDVCSSALIYNDSNNTISKLKSSDIGRPPRYNWPEFHATAAIIASQKSIPTDRGGQAQLEKIMAEWCSVNWSQGEPSQSLIREHCKPVFEAYKAGKFA